MKRYARTASKKANVKRFHEAVVEDQLIEFAVVEFDDSCDESQTLVEVIPSKWLFDSNTKCKYPPKKDKLKTTRLIMSNVDPGHDWNIYNLRFHHYYNTYNTALKATKTVLAGEVARTDADTDYAQPRKRKKNSRYISSSSEDEEVDKSLSNAPFGTSSEVSAPDSLLPNKLKLLLKNKSAKTSTIYEQKNTCVGKLFSRNKWHDKSLNPLQSDHDTTSDENAKKKHSLLNEVARQRYLTSKGCSTKMSKTSVTTKLHNQIPQSKITKSVTKLQTIFQHSDKENSPNSSDRKSISQKCLSPQLNMDDKEQPTTSDNSSVSVHMQYNFLGRKENTLLKEINKSSSLKSAFDNYDKNSNKHNENVTDTIYSESSKDKSEDDVSEEERTSMNNENRTASSSSSLQSLSNADRDLLLTTLNHLKKLHGPIVSNLDRDLLRDVSSKLDIMLINQRRILNEIFPNKTIVERPENYPPLPLRDENSFKAFNEFLNDKIAFSQFVSYLNGHIVDDSDQWSTATCLMSVMLHNELARQVSWKGTGGIKISFYGTRIKEALFCAIMGHFKNQSLKKAEEAMKRWLNTSGQRK